MIDVDTSPVGLVEFDVPSHKLDELVANGESSAKQVLNGRNWDRYKRDCLGVTDGI